MDSPVKVPVASEMPRCAPPHTFRAGEEPCQGDDVIGPVPTSTGSRRCCAAARYSCRSLQPQNLEKGELTVCGTNRPDADAAKSVSACQPGQRTGRGSAACFPRSGHSTQSKSPKSKPAIRCARVLRLRCRLSGLMQPRRTQVQKGERDARVFRSGNSAAQIISPNRSFNRVDLGRFQTD